MTNTEFENFSKDLNELLKKHNVEIYSECDYDSRETSIGFCKDATFENGDIVSKGFDVYAEGNSLTHSNFNFEGIKNV